MSCAEPEQANEKTFALPSVGSIAFPENKKMKMPLIFASMLYLTACAGTDSGIAAKVFPLHVLSLIPSTDPATRSVDVSASVRNIDGYTLRSATLTIAGYDAEGTKTTADYLLQIDGPLSAKDNSGMLVKRDVWHDVKVSCIEIISAKVTSMDYATDYAQGIVARTIVAGHDRKPCHVP
jgi:hypothetical protein